MYVGNSFVAPIIFTLENHNPPTVRVVLFLPSKNRTLPNNGLPAGVTLTFNYNTLSYSYDQLLGDAQDEPFQIWKFRFYQRIPKIVKPPLPGSIAQLNEVIDVIQRESDGSLTSYPLQPYQDLDQTAANAMEFRDNVIIDNDRGLAFQLHGKHRLQFWLWIDKNSSLVNKLVNGTSEHIFSKPFPLEAKNPYLVRISYKTGGIDFME